MAAAVDRVSPSLFAHALKMTTHGAFTTRSSIKPAWRRQLAVPLSPYGLSSFCYTFAGLYAMVAWFFCPGAMPGWPARVAFPEASLVVLQGAWSFLSDVINVGRPCIFHAVDRISAVSLTAFQLCKFGLLMVTDLSGMQAIFIVVGLGLGIGCKLQGYRAILNGHVERYRHWHLLWHLSLPLAVSALHSWRWRTCQKCILE